jgi:hypothetical protein
VPRILIRPDPHVIGSVVERAVIPVIREIERDLGRSLPTVVTPWTPAMEGPKILVSTESSAVAAQDLMPVGELRLSFRESAVEGRLLFFGEAVYAEGISPTTGFSGFDIRGTVRTNADPVQVEELSRTIKYKVWRFRGWR